MKQRLLLALLMLLTSAGFMKVDAQISITLPKTESRKKLQLLLRERPLLQVILIQVHIHILEPVLNQLRLLLQL